MLFVEISLGHCWTVSSVSAGIGWSKGKWFYVFFEAQRNKRELMLIKDNKGMFLSLRCLNYMEKRQKFKKTNNKTRVLKTFRRDCVGSYIDISKVTVIFCSEFMW